jgi:hypothetical protein
MSHAGSNFDLGYVLRKFLVLVTGSEGEVGKRIGVTFDLSILLGFAFQGYLNFLALIYEIYPS